ncbi:MAG TPA: uracil-DNA glycosylase [Pyrinomonadaceae bacterium]|jgi:DNA polymerase|nr:uracil-DNA glycosylase [Pyrinomonadaceae bacterium]
MKNNGCKDADFAALVAEAAACVRCPAMCDRAAVLSELNGDVDARVLFIGEAPGRKGADRTRVPFSGDQSGRNFDRFLASIDLKRSQIFITSAALCNPRTASGANRRPTSRELNNCSEFLRRTIELVDPPVIVTLGGVALEALKSIHEHQFTLRNDAAKVRHWNGRTLIPLYHPSPQVLITRRNEKVQLRDYRVVGRAMNQTAEPVIFPKSKVVSQILK